MWTNEIEGWAACQSASHAAWTGQSQSDAEATVELDKLNSLEQSKVLRKKLVWVLNQSHEKMEETDTVYMNRKEPKHSPKLG